MNYYYISPPDFFYPTGIAGTGTVPTDPIAAAEMITPFL